MRVDSIDIHTYFGLFVSFVHPHYRPTGEQFRNSSEALEDLAVCSLVASLAFATWGGFCAYGGSWAIGLGTLPLLSCSAVTYAISADLYEMSKNMTGIWEDNVHIPRGQEFFEQLTDSTLLGQRVVRWYFSC